MLALADDAALARLAIRRHPPSPAARVRDGCAGVRHARARGVMQRGSAQGSYGT